MSTIDHGECIWNSMIMHQLSYIITSILERVNKLYRNSVMYVTLFNGGGD